MIRLLFYFCAGAKRRRLLFETRVSKWSSVNHSAVKEILAPKAPNSRIYMRVLQISWNFDKSSNIYAYGFFAKFIESYSAGFNAYWHWVISTSIFRKSWKSVFFFEIRKIEPFPGSPFSDHFWRLFFEKFCIALFLGKILVANYRIVCEVNFAPKAQNFSTDIRKSAVLDAVLEDKPAQPLPCGSYLV